MFIPGTDRSSGQVARTRAVIGLATTLIIGAALPARAASGPSAADAALPAAVSSRIEAAVADAAPAMIETRHRLHAHPELGNQETLTAGRVAKRLRALEFDSVATGVAHTGVVGVLEGGRPGPVVAVRADMDALPVKEQTGFAFASERTTQWEGKQVPVMHACGHDIHTSVALGVASVLAAMREQLPGTVKFIFQPAEEGPPAGEDGGASLMLEQGALENPRPEAIFALHASPALEVGQLGYVSGPVMAAVDHFWITIEGEQAHGAYPQQGVDPIVMASQAVSALQTIRSRNLPPRAASVVTVGMIHGGKRFNIIPSVVELEGTVRTFDTAVRETIEQRMDAILAGMTSAGGGDYALRYQHNTPPNINDPALTRDVLPGLVAAVGADAVHEGEPTMGGEDFAYFSQAIPGFYFSLGTTAPGGSSGGVHTPTYRGDDSAIPVGMRAMSSVVLEYLHGAHAGDTARAAAR